MKNNCSYSQNVIEMFVRFTYFLKYDLIHCAVFLWIELFVMLCEYQIKNLLSSCFVVSLLGDMILPKGVDFLWCQPIKLIQVVSTSEFHEYILMERC